VANILGTPLGNLDAEECMLGFIGNRRTRELPIRETRQCQLDEIIHSLPFSSSEDAFAEGYNGRAHCMPQHHHR
jgi:hypothetical protein